MGEGPGYVVIQLEDNFIRLFSPNIPYLVDEVKPGYDLIANYRPSRTLEPYSPRFLVLFIEELEDEERSEATLWPTELPAVEELLATGEVSAVLIEEELVSPVFNAFPPQKSSGYFQDGEKLYWIDLYPLLPHETPNQLAQYPDRPRDYVSLLECDGDARLISPAVPTATPTLSASASRLTGKGRVLYVTDADGDDEIYVMEADGTNHMRLTNNLANDRSPAWSMDGKLIAFESDRDGDREIFVMAADGTGVTQLTDNEVDDYSPSWSPSGYQIAFVSDRDGGWKLSEIYLMNGDGSDQRRLTNNSSRDLDPDWSSDGRQILFSRELLFNEFYNTRSIDVSQETLVVGQSKFVYQTRYSGSPDGLMLAVTNQADNGDWEIQVVNPETKVTQVYDIQVDLPWFLDWTNDGKFILFSGYGAGDGYGGIYALELSSGEQILLTNSEYRESDPSLWP